MFTGDGLYKILHKMVNAKMDNGPVKFAKDMAQQVFYKEN